MNSLPPEAASQRPFLDVELRRLDLLLHREVLRMRARYALSLDEFRGLYISDEQVDTALRSAQEKSAGVSIEALAVRAAELAASSKVLLSPRIPWARLVVEYGLSTFERDVLLLALAPEIDVKYETVYAYLNNDITRKWPSNDLALRLFSEGECGRIENQRYLIPAASLLRDGLLVPVGRTADRPSWLSAGFTISQPVAAFLLGLGAYTSLASAYANMVRGRMSWDDLQVSEGLRSRLTLAAGFFTGRDGERPAPGPVLVFEGEAGSGKANAATALCTQLGAMLLRFDVGRAKVTGHPLEDAVAQVGLCARLDGAGLLVEGAEWLFGVEGVASLEARTLMESLASLRGPVILSCQPGLPWRELLRGRRYLHFAFEAPGYEERARLWSECAADVGVHLNEADVEALTERFVLTPGQIRSAVEAAADAHSLNRGHGEHLSLAALLEQARSQSDRGLGRVAVKVTSKHTWEDLVLPPATLRQAREVSAAIQHHHLVYSQWGFSHRITTGRGLKVLFAGASGTGKTMTAGVIARELGLDLYKIDLSAVVSKYIGETEKNLDRIFAAAHAANAILFFDEADALFGKRSEVKDAHDRYANIEISYLLQKLEEHEGAVILASNLSHNIDQAFSRRMHYMVEFPLPNEEQREQLWRGMFPSQAPVADDVDFSFIARQFSFSGGEIQNTALDAAFLAATDGKVITMAHLVKAVSRQMLKGGRVPSATDFREYYRLVAV